MKDGDTQLPTIQVGGFGASLDGYAVARDPSRPWNPHACHLWYASLLGPQEAIRAIRARLLKGQEATVTDGALGRVRWVSLPPGEKKGWKWTQVALPRAAGHHGLLIPEIALYPTERDEFLLIPEQGRDRELFYRFLNRRVDVPLHPEWADWLWTRAAHTGELVGLDGRGPKAYLCRADAGSLRVDLSAAISCGDLQVGSAAQESIAA